MKKILLCIIILLASFVTPVCAEEVTVGYSFMDGGIYNGGIYDVKVHVSSGANRAVYQWQVDASFGEDSWYDLEESNSQYGYHGTKTSHFQFITQAKDNSYEVGTGWENIPFRCKVTLDGKTYYTAPFTMNFIPHSSFLSYVKNQSFGLTDVSVRGLSAQREMNGAIYGETYLGEQLVFKAGCTQPSENSVLFNSDVRFVPEIVINDNGREKKAGQEASYVPTAAGTDVLIVDYRVRMMMGVNDLGIYDTYRAYISVFEPDAKGVGYTKHDLHLLKEMYNESEKVLYLPKNSQVSLIENIGGTWYKVMHNSTVGYVPVSSIVLRDKIPYVSVHVDDPYPGNVPFLTAQINGKGYQNYFSDPVTWLDKTTGKLMKHGERFIEGHAYQVSIWLSALNEYEFDTYDGEPNVQATINGHAANVVRAYEQSPDEVIELIYDYGVLQKAHICTPNLVKRVEPTCSSTGFEAYWHCECGLNYKDGRGREQVQLNEWGTIPALSHQEGDLKYNGTHHYRKCIYCNTVIAGTTESHSGGTATCTSLAECSTCGFEYGMYAEHQYSKEWTALSDEGHVHLCTNKECPAHDTILSHRKGPDSTETSPQVCLDCGYILAPVKNHTHLLSKVEHTEATCMLAGNTEYYVCSGCSDLFIDAGGKQKISDTSSVVISPLGHMISELWMNDEMVHYRTCEICGIVVEETKMIHEDIDQDHRCDTCYFYMSEHVLSHEPDAEENDPEPMPQTSEAPASLEQGPNPFVLFGGGFASALVLILLILKKRKL